MAKKKLGEKLTTEIREVTNPDRWDFSHGTYIAGRAHIDGVEAMAREMDAYWGVDRLRLLVPAEVREKFDRQRYLYQAAVHNGDLEAVRIQSLRMQTAWQALNRIAGDAGALPLDPQVIEIGLQDGTIAAIVPDAARGSLVRAEGRGVAVYTLEEIALILSQASLTAMVEMKLKWPGATVQAARSNRDPLDAIDYPTGLDTPFDDGVPSLGSGKIS